MAIHSIRDGGGEPNTWKLQLFANIGGSEEFVAQVAIEMEELVNASMIYGEHREKLQEAILAISFEGLMPAFEHLKAIRTLPEHPVAELNRKQLYEDFTRVLWHSYKDLMQKAAKMMEPEFGFLFQKDTQFESGLTAWEKKRPEMAQAMAGYFQSCRTEWQNDLSTFRNYLEHKDETDPKIFAGRYDSAYAESLFENVWRMIADILAMLISLHLPPRLRLVEIPLEHRNKIMPRRFGFHVEGLPTAQQE
jgi:hypothetical protein